MCINKQYRYIIQELDNGMITQKQFLDWLYNKCGPFMVQSHTLGKEDRMSKWHDWAAARENEYFSNSVNHRTIAKCELVFDIDLPKWLNDNERQSFLNATLRRLREKYNIEPVIIDTGKGYHLHYFDINMFIGMMNSSNPIEFKRKYAQEIMADVRSDMMKWNDRSMIAIECSKHWKRGTKTKLVTF